MFLVVLLLSLLQCSNRLDSIQVDLNGDGEDDQVRLLLELGENSRSVGDSLEIRLSGIGVFSFELPEVEPLDDVFEPFLIDKYVARIKGREVQYLLLSNKGFGCCLPELVIIKIEPNSVVQVFRGESDVSSIETMKDCDPFITVLKSVPESFETEIDGTLKCVTKLVPFEVYRLSENLEYDEQKSSFFNMKYYGISASEYPRYVKDCLTGKILQLR